MKQGMTLQELAIQVSDNSQRKQDYVVNVRTLDFGIDAEGNVEFHTPVKDYGSVGGSMTPHATKQMTTELGIPAAFVDTLKREDPSYLPELMNRRAYTIDNNAKEPHQRMIRTIGSKAVAAVSPSFSREYDNDIMLAAILPTLRESELEVESCNLSDTTMHLKALSPRLRGDVGVGDFVQGGINMRNSDVGLSRALINELMKRLTCLNGMTRTETVNAYKRIHRGSRLPTGFIPSVETTTAHQQAIALEMRDVVRHLLSPDRFAETVSAVQATKERELSAKNLEAGVYALGKIVGFTQTEGDDILAHLIQGGELNQFGMLNAVTRYSQDVDSYDRASELEQIGGKVLELNPRQWKVITEAQEAA